MKKNGLWIIKDTKIVYKNPWMEVREDQVIRPDGKDGIYGTVFFGEAGAHILPFDAENNVYLIREFAYGTGREEVTIIAGAVESGETPLEAAKRELREEAGIIAGAWTHLGFATPHTTFMKLDNHMFIAKELAFTEHARESTEQIELMKMPFTKAVEKVLNGEIRSEMTCLAILRAKLHLEGGV